MQDSVKIGFVKSPAKLGDRVTVYFNDDTSGEFIAVHDIVSTKVAVIGNRAFSEDRSQAVLSTNIKLFKNRIDYNDANPVHFASLWQEFYDSPEPINFVTPRYRRNNGDRSQYNHRYTMGSSGWDTLAQAADLYPTLFPGYAGKYLAHYFDVDRNWGLTIRKNARPDESFQLDKEGFEYIDSAVENFRSGTGLFSQYFYNGAKTFDSYGYLAYTATYGYEASQEKIKYDTRDDPNSIVMQGIQDYYAGGQYTPEIRMTAPSVPDVPRTNSATGNHLAKLRIDYRWKLFIAAPYRLDLPSNKSVRWWLNFHDRPSNPIELLTCNHLELIQVFLTMLDDKAIFIAKMGRALGWYFTDPPSKSNQGFTIPEYPSEWGKIIVIEVTKSGEKTEKTYTYPEVVPPDPDNWQQWAYSYKNFRDLEEKGETHEYSDDCAFKLSSGFRRVRAINEEFNGISFDRNKSKEYTFLGEPFFHGYDGDYNNPYAAAGYSKNYIVPVLPYTHTLADFLAQNPYRTE